MNFILGRHYITYICSLLIIISCSGEVEQSHVVQRLFFLPNDAKELSSIELDTLYNKELITLETTPFFSKISSPSLLESDSGYFLFQRYSNNIPISHFNKNGDYVNEIGSTGLNNSQYNRINDIFIDKTGKKIHVLENNSLVCVYGINGEAVESYKFEIPPSHSFFMEDDGSYWFAIGNNPSYGEETVYRVNMHNSVEKFLSESTRLFPIPEDNFYSTRNGYAIYRKIFSNYIYRINKELIPIYYIDFGIYNFPFPLDMIDPMTFSREIKNHNYARLNSFFENNIYIYATIGLYEMGKSTPTNYHWIINKTTGAKALYSLNEDILPVSYFHSPQYIDDENNIVYIGYEEEGDNIICSPMIVKIPIATMFNLN